MLFEEAHSTGIRKRKIAKIMPLKKYETKQNSRNKNLLLRNSNALILIY